MPKKNLGNCLSKFSKRLSAISIVFDSGFCLRFAHKVHNFCLSILKIATFDVFFPKPKPFQPKFCLGSFKNYPLMLMRVAEQSISLGRRSNALVIYLTGGFYHLICHVINFIQSVPLLRRRGRMVYGAGFVV